MRIIVKKFVIVVSIFIVFMGVGYVVVEIQIGIVGLMIGFVVQYGDMQFFGVCMVIQQINVNGGVMGEELVGVEYDDVCDLKQVVIVVNNLVNDGVCFVVGYLCFSFIQFVFDIYEDEGILMVILVFISLEIIECGYELVFCIIGLDSMQGLVVGNYIVSLNFECVVIVYDKQQYGEGIVIVVCDILKNQGVEIVMFEGIIVGDKDFFFLVIKFK